MADLRSRLARRLQNAWRRRGRLAWLLWPISRVYGALHATRVALYRHGWLRSETLPVPVVVIGNVVAGGAGKTPTVIALVEHLRGRGLQVGIVSRGHGGSLAREGRWHEVRETDDPAWTGDEPLLLRRRTGVPVFVGRRRAEAGRALLAAHPDVQVLVCDDGLQHLALARDVEVCVFDDRGTGNGWLLPAGPLREPWPRRVDAVLHTGTHPAFVGGFAGERRLADGAYRADGEVCSLAALAHAPGRVAVAGIAEPEAFFRMLRSAGVVPHTTVALPDHYDFDSWSRTSALCETLICTEKDAAKLWRHAPGAWAVPLRFAPEPSFFAAVDRLLDARLSSPAPSPLPDS